MRIVILLLLLLGVGGVQSRPDELLARQLVEPMQACLEISRLLDIEQNIEISSLVDFIDRENKIELCINQYIEKQSKVYSRVVQENLYDMIHNFDKITSKIRGKKPEIDLVPFDTKISALARVQCEIYYLLGGLK